MYHSAKRGPDGKKNILIQMSQLTQYKKQLIQII